MILQLPLTDTTRTREPARQRMEAQTGQRHVLNCYRGVQGAQNQPESLVVLRPDAGVATGLEEFAQSLMGETANHEADCNP